MNNKIKVVLYYVCALLSGIILFAVTHTGYATDSSLLKIISIVNVILVIFVTILLFKRSLTNYKVITPIVYVVFLILMTIIMLFFNQKFRYPYMSASYHITFILIGYTVLNIYTLLSFDKKNK